MPKPRRIFLGLRAKTARAIAVALGDPDDDGPSVVLRQEIPLWEPRNPDSRQPHHAGLELDGAAAGRVVERAERAVSRAADRELARLADLLSERGERIARVVVVGSDSDPSRIGNPHVRAHAAEGRLFRDVLERAAASLALPCEGLRDKSAWDEAAAALGCSVAVLQRHATNLGKAVGPPWRADEKLACAAALLAHAHG